MKNGDTIESKRDIEENNFLGDYYLEEEEMIDDTYESSGTKCNYHYSKLVRLKNQYIKSMIFYFDFCRIPLNCHEFFQSIQCMRKKK